MEIHFSVTTPLAYTIRTTKSYWQYVVEIKHPSMVNKENIVQETLQNPDKICKSMLDDTVYLYYRKIEQLYCAVVKHISSKEGFLITAYPADKIKEKETIWTR